MTCNPEEMLERVEALEVQMQSIILRNQRVEANKAWETSRTRLVAVTAVTYVTMILVFVVLGSNRPVLDAVVPTTGFFLSTLSLPIIRRVWGRKVTQPSEVLVLPIKHPKADLTENQEHL